MSVIQSIRDRGAWIMLVLIALALIAFILQDGLGRGRGGSIFSNTTTVGKVNGNKISKDEFDAKLTLYGRNGASRDNLIPQLWEQEVNSILQQEEYDKLGLRASNKEIMDFLTGPQSPLGRSQGFLNENGQIDPARVQEYIAQAKKSKNPEDQQQVVSLWDEATKQVLYSKYQNLISKAYYVPTWFVEKQKAEEASIASISYVYVPYASIVDSTVKVSDAEINAYVKKHPKGFEKEFETRTFSYVTFDAYASAADSNAALNKVALLKNDFQAATNVKAFLSKVGSDLPYLDGYTIKSQMKMPKADSIKALAIGQTFGPYLDGGNYTIAKMIDVKTIPDSVFCKHILVRTGEGGLSDSLASKKIDSIIGVLNSGADFTAVMQQASDDKAANKMDGGLMKFNAAQMQSENFDQDFAKYILFDGKQGEKRKVKTKFGYHYIYIVEQKNFEPAAKVAYLAKAITVSNETSTAANTAALQFASGAKNKVQFEEAAKKLNKTVLQSQEIKQDDFSVPMFGQAPTRGVVRWLFENDLGTVSEPTDVGDRYMVAIINSISPKGLKGANEVRPQVEVLIRNEKKAKQIIETKFKGSSLENYAASAGVSVQKADSLTFSNPMIPGLGGFDMKATGLAFNNALKGKVSEPIAGSNGVYAIRVETIGAKAITQDGEAIKQRLQQMMEQSRSRAGNPLKKAATIKDYRFKFY
jgi:peptidyl-prolyl cis-trans isomerase D